MTTAGGITLLLGGARSGKSSLAVQIAQRHCGGVTFLATAEALDDDMRERIARHRRERPGWPTIEAPLNLAEAIRTVGVEDLILVDCLTLWVSNGLLAGWSDADVDARAHDAADAARSRGGPTVVISNEVGLGVHPETELGRRYRDVLGRVNQQWAAAADRTLLLIAGRAVAMHDPWELIT